MRKPTPSTSDDRVKMAYDAALARLEDQTETFANLRNRATWLLGTAALTTSFSTSLGLVQIGSGSTSPQYPEWALWALLATFILIGFATFLILWPVPWYYGASANKIIERYELDQSEEDLRKYVISECKKGSDSNKDKLTVRANLFRASVALLLAELAILITSVALARS